MKTLSEMGLIHPVGYSAEGVRFDADRTPHHHFLCSVCGEAYDFICPELDAIPVPKQAERIGTVRGSRIEVRGVCRDCLAKEGGVK
jgi:Fur family peroxide stress response transcriptional regulator